MSAYGVCLSLFFSFSGSYECGVWKSIYKSPSIGFVNKIYQPNVDVMTVNTK